MTTTTAGPRPYSFQVEVPEWGWVTFTEGKTDIPSILDRLWEQAHERRLPIRVLPEQRRPPGWGT